MNCVVGLSALMLFSCGAVPSVKSWHPEKPITRFAAEPWGTTIYPPPQVESAALKSIGIGDSENTIRSVIGEYPASWGRGSGVLTEVNGVTYEVAYLYADQTGYIKDISYKRLEPSQVVQRHFEPVTRGN
jgi:hypothetical protein